VRQQGPANRWALPKSQVEHWHLLESKMGNEKRNWFIEADKIHLRLDRWTVWGIAAIRRPSGFRSIQVLVQRCPGLLRYYGANATRQSADAGLRGGTDGDQELRVRGRCLHHSNDGRTANLRRNGPTADSAAYGPSGCNM
jgi:hypothetical protein